MCLAIPVEITELLADDMAHARARSKSARLVAALGGTCKRVFLVACEPLTFGGEEGVMGLSEPVVAALGAAVKTVEDLVAEMADAESREVPTSVAQRIT